MTNIPGGRLIAAIARLVPAPHREEWQAEWLGELAAHSQGNPWPASIALRLRCLGAISDAFWFRRRYREPLMISQNLRFAMRLMRRRPAFSSIVILTLALGIGGTTAIYSVVNAVLLRSLPYPDPEQLVMVWGEATDGNTEKVSTWGSHPDYLDYRSQIHAFSELAAYRSPLATLTTAGGDARFVETALTTSNIFKVFAVEAVLGRTYRPEEEVPGAPPVAVLSHDFWLAQFAGDPGVLGKVVHLDGQPYSIIGVLPERFRFDGTDLWLPLVPGQMESSRGTHTLQLFGRIRPGTSRETAEQEAKTVAARLEAQYPGENAKRSVRLEGLQDAAVGQSRDFLLALMGGVVLVLLIVCTNVANLFLVRAAGREREMAVRTALGAGQSRLFHQFLTESMLLTILGAVLGLPLAWWGVRALVAGAPQGLPQLNDIGIDGAALGFMLVIAVAAGLVFGVVPAIYASRHTIAQRIRERGMGPRHARVSRGFVITQIALAGVLVIGASLLGKSLWRLNQVDLRFNPDNLLVARIQLPRSRYPDPQKVLTFFSDVRSRLSAEPGVQSVTTAFEHPLSEGWTSSYVVSDAERPKEGEEPEARVRPVSPGYFQGMGLSLVRGRDLDNNAAFGTPGEVIVNEAFVRRHFPDTDPVGKRIERQPWWPGQPASWEIVGVVGNERFPGLAMEADPATYFPHAQFPMNEMYLLVRTANDPALLRDVIRRDIGAIDHDLAIESIPTMADIVGGLTAVPRFNVQLIGLFAIVALLLAAIGVYGVLAQMVTQRTPEIGIRLALGADRVTVVRMVVGQALRLSLVGAGAGLLLALGATRILAAQLYGVETRDPTVFGTVAAVLVLIALLAAYLPGRRASRVDPIVALRND
jgi:putative ABC transport system permease protein